MFAGAAGVPTIPWSTATVSLAVIDRATWPAMDSRVNSSVTFRTLILRPLEMSSNRKSIAQTWSGWDACTCPGAWRPRRRLFLRAGTLQSFFPPDPAHALAVHLPALPAEDRVLLLVAKTRVAPGELTQALAQVLLVGNEGPAVTLGGTVLAYDDAGSSLRGPETTLHAMARLTSTLGAYQFPFATSFSMSMSRAWLATSFFSRAFSFCRFFSTTISSAHP